MRQSNRRHALAASAAAVAALLVPGLTWIAPAAHAGALPPLGDDFLWGVAASGFQSEGAVPDSNWSRFIESGAVDDYRDSVRFLDFYTDDIDHAARLGVKVFRMSVEWARVQPTPDGWDEHAFQVYDRMVDKIIAYGMTPMITLDHWVYPGWAADRGGWRNPGMVEDWLANARKVVNRFASRKPIWVTINEPAAYIGTELRIGALGPGEEPLMRERLAQVHNEIYDTIHHNQPDAQVTSNLGYVPGMETEVNQPFVDLVADKLDFLGVDYYFGPDDHSAAGETSAGSPAMWELPLQTEGIYYALRHYARLFPGKPLYVVESGMPTENGRPRPDGYTRVDHLRDTVYWLQRAKADGIDVRGYNYWSLTDNYEWGSYAPRFGLYTVDAEQDPTLTRHPTDAVEAYATLTRTGGVPADYRPTRGPVECSQVDPPASCDEPVTVDPESPAP
ncbi:family 1 glycosylhydrolase [Nocardia wallacei]|uniref:Putative glycosyl hydrolase (Beta-glucosidase) n=1 Tax=Nocardia wallacei TaxID=480035 RepID=A0A7G1KMC0_9NOCA|nr:family 1 glycosylhydrolase [Nocardia wallacei]BCK55736.1 putative glycosyl hydrolase (beta-glucosidase) [Nocardia wallacei]